MTNLSSVGVLSTQEGAGAVRQQFEVFQGIEEYVRIESKPGCVGQTPLEQ
jgi:hypothetical protein